MDAFAALLDEALDGAVGRGGSSNSIVVSPAFSIATRTFCSGTSSMCESFKPSVVDPEFLRLVDALYGDADVVDALDHDDFAFVL